MHVNRDKFYMAITQELIEYEVTQLDLVDTPREDKHTPICCDGTVCPQCVICLLERGMMKNKKTDDLKDGYEKLQRAKSPMVQ